jgi:hypothetical protein
MTIFIQNDATGAGGGNLDPNQAAVDLTIIANGDTGLGLAAQVGNRQQVTYARTLAGAPPIRLDNLVNTNFNPNYGGGPQNVNIIILPVLANFTLNDGRSILTVGGTALPPSNSGLAAAGLNNTNDCLVIYDTTQNNGTGYCTARAGTGGTLDLQTPNPIILFHELSHAFRIVTNALLALSGICNPSSPEENAAITDENDLRTQIANASGTTPVLLRDPGIHCGAVCSGGSTSTSSCCIIASVASGSVLSEEVAALRTVRDSLLRKSEIGFYFFQSFFHDYYGFSPQVCTLMSQHSTLRQLVCEGFVRPLVSILNLINEYAVSGVNAATLGKHFAAAHADRVAATEILNRIDQASEVLKAIDSGVMDVQHELAHRISPALKSEHLSWAIIEPIKLYKSVLESHLNEYSFERLGEQLYEGISLWAVQLPLDDIWTSLSFAELQDEIALIERILLRTSEARASFRDRLNRTFGNFPAVAKVLSEKISRFEGNEL